MSRWFRFYGDAMRNPKVIGLNDRDFRTWVGLLAIASEHNGRIPPATTVKTLLSMRLDHLLAALQRLVKAGLIDELADCYEPHNWEKFQYKSDTSTKRVTLHRKRKRGEDETAPETETDTDTSVDKSTGTVVPLIDPEKVMFDTGIRYLATCGIAESKARPQLGKWKRDHGAGAVIEALGAAQRQGVMDPMGWIEGRWRADRQSVRQPAVPL
jgi:hypothetical protein